MRHTGDASLTAQACFRFLGQVFLRAFRLSGLGRSAPGSVSSGCFVNAGAFVPSGLQETLSKGAGSVVVKSAGNAGTDRQPSRNIFA